MAATDGTIEGTDRYSGGPNDRLAPVIAKASEKKLAEYDEQLDAIATSPVAIWTRERLVGVRGMIQKRYVELRGGEKKAEK